MDIKRSIAKRWDRLLKLIGLERIKKVDLPIINLYRTNYEKTVLISYITLPFRDSNHFRHQNYITSHIVAECFSELGYNVDLVSFAEDRVKLDYGKYAVFFGFGYHFEQSFYHHDRAIPRIHFITGAHRDLHNQMGLKSLLDFRKATGSWVRAAANIAADGNYMSLFNADAGIILAQGFIREDYQSRFVNKVYSLKNNIIGTFSGFGAKQVRNSNFLFLSGNFLITKGLSLLLEVAKLRKDINFYIVVPFLDDDMEACYWEILYESDHVFLHCNLRMDAQEMKDIITTCSYTVAPSYIDGLPGGTIEPMSAGLVPIVSKYCGFEAKDFIFELKDLSVEGLNETINEALAIDDTTYFEYSKAVKAYTNQYFSPANVKMELKQILTTGIGL